MKRNRMLEEKERFKIESFWDWFVGMEARYKQFFIEDGFVDKKTLVEAMNNRVLDFGLFSWQIGPGKDGYYLTISPNGSPELLAKSKSIVEFAPLLPGWEFYPAKQAKPGELSFSLYDNFMIERFIDAADWNFVLRKRPDHMIDIILEAHTIRDLDEDTQGTAGDMLVTRIIGEERKINRVGRIIVLGELPETDTSNREPISQLRNRIR